MDKTHNFIAIPSRPLGFVERMTISLSTSLRFIKDQSLPSLIFLAIYLAFMVWDYRALVGSPVVSPNDEWVARLPDYLSLLKTQLNNQSHVTWRASLASFIMVLYWGNALLYIADRSEAFQTRTVVGLVRYLTRSAVICLLLITPVIGGFVLLLLPGLFMFSVMVVAASLCLFDDLPSFRAIGHGFRLISQGIPGQKRSYGFSQTLLDVLAIHALIIVSTLLFGALSTMLADTLSHFMPTKALVFGHIELVLSSIFSAFLNLSLAIFILRTYSEQLHAQPQVS